MRKGTLIALGAAGVLTATAVGAVVATSMDNDGGFELASNDGAVVDTVKRDCRSVATAETGFDPATTPVPIREDAGNKQVLKGTAVGAAFGAVAGEVIGDKAGYGAAAGAAAGAAGGQAVKADKQQKADERYEYSRAEYEQRKAAYDAALNTCLND
jgi:uncharacterized protein YcfJ